MKKFKIFFGDLEDGRTADEKVNEWLNNEGRYVEIINFQYAHSRFGDHSICIEYEENHTPYCAIK